MRWFTHMCGVTDGINWAWELLIVPYYDSITFYQVVIVNFLIGMSPYPHNVPIVIEILPLLRSDAFDLTDPGRLGHQHQESFYISVWHQHRISVTNITVTSLLLWLTLRFLRYLCKNLNTTQKEPSVSQSERLEEVYYSYITNTRMILFK